MQLANIWGAEFHGADLGETEIEEKWRDAINWEDLDLDGNPNFVENMIDDELPPHPED